MDGFPYPFHCYCRHDVIPAAAYASPYRVGPSRVGEAVNIRYFVLVSEICNFTLDFHRYLGGWPANACGAQ